MIKAAGADTRPADHQKQSEVKTMTDLELKIKEAEHAINALIDDSARNYEANHKSNNFDWNWHYKQMARLNGMIEVLKIFTGKDYFYDANGLHERKA